MTQSCCLAWLESCSTADSPSPGSSHTVTQPPLHHCCWHLPKGCMSCSGCGHLGDLQPPQDAPEMSRDVHCIITPGREIPAVRSRLTQPDTACPEQTASGQLCWAHSITHSWKAARELSWSWDLPSQRVLPLQTPLAESCIQYLSHYSWNILLLLPSGNSHSSDMQKAEIISSLLPAYLICEKTPLGSWGWGVFKACL